MAFHSNSNLFQLLVSIFPTLALGQTQFGGQSTADASGRSPTSFNPSGFDFLNSLRGAPRGSSTQALGNRFALTGENLKNVDWTQIDRRAEESWYHLYPFGEKFFDMDVGERPWKDTQIDLDFFFPYYGFRFNYTFLFPEGFIAFSYPWYIQPPYTFPNPRWPERADPALIAAFMSEQQFMYVGQIGISHLWQRVIMRPTSMIGQSLDDRTYRPRPDINLASGTETSQGVFGKPDSRYHRTYRGHVLKTTDGRVEDPELLDQITYDIRNSIVGARGFTADYVLLVTWERMAYGGAPKATELHLYDQVRRWQNTYQLLIATDEIRSYVMMNYANINWTSSTAAGALFGRGGKQSAMVGFNGGNGTGWYELPYSAEGNSYKLVQFGSTKTAGRWIARVDEEIQYGGCTNDSTGNVQLSETYGSMLGGFSLNVSGPCFRPTDVVKLQLDELTVDCERIDMVVSRCVIPVHKIYRIGMVEVKMSTDGGTTYPWWNYFYILPPANHVSKVNLINDPVEPINNWNNPLAKELSLQWPAANISANPNAYVDICLYGYWEDVEGHVLTEIGKLAERQANTGQYTFSPNTLGLNQFGTELPDAWQWYRGGFVQAPCPCTLDQAIVDVGRFTPLPDCDMVGNHECYYTQGAKHCVMSTLSVTSGAGQVCCYDIDGFMMFSQDYEYNEYYLNYYSAGVPYRAHPWGAAPYKLPPYVPTLSNLHNDLLPYEFCCRWASHCEFFFWRRPTSGCQEYRPPSVGFAYGEPHFITYDGLKYTFNGKGYYVLSAMHSPTHDLMVQVRMEQPPKTLWDTQVAATVITGVAAKDNKSAIVQVFARKHFRQWRYKTDVYVDGIRVFFDMGYKKTQIFKGSGSAPRGLLNVMVSLPPSYNETEKRYTGGLYPYGGDQRRPLGRAGGSTQGEAKYSSTSKCGTHHRTVGLLGVLNSDRRDDLTTPDCNVIGVHSYPPSTGELRAIYHNFGEKWRVDGITYRLLFQTERHPINNPLSFASPNYEPLFDPWTNQNQSFWQSLIFTRDEVRVTCQQVPSCEYDYIMTGRREIAIDTLDSERKFEGLKYHGETRRQSCGPLEKGFGVIKRPIGDNYMDGVTVSFTCKPDYFLHGEQQRTCINGTWTSGWWAWCRTRNLEIFLKWMTGILSSLMIIMCIGGIFLCCYFRRLREGNYPPPPPRGYVQPANRGRPIVRYGTPMGGYKAGPPPAMHPPAATHLPPSYNSQPRAASATPANSSLSSVQQRAASAMAPPPGAMATGAGALVRHASQNNVARYSETAA